MDLLTILVSPEYGAEAIKVGVVYLLFHKDIKGLGKEVKDLAAAFWAHVAQNDKELKAIKAHIKFNNSPQNGAEGDNNGDT